MSSVISLTFGSRFCGMTVFGLGVSGALMPNLRSSMLYGVRPWNNFVASQPIFEWYFVLCFITAI